MNLDFAARQQLLEENNILVRLGMLYGFLNREVDILNLERQIQEEVKENVDKSQRDYYLREQMKVISSSWGRTKPGRMMPMTTWSESKPWSCPRNAAIS